MTFAEYISKIAFTIPWVKIPVNTFVVHFVLVVAAIVAGNLLGFY